ncbi:MAG TPA: hypothetical protein PK277_09510, partial [Methanoregulaceae archaeon]|nr:hypothetical protein [Methanoregulaceae archaeon]
CWQIETPRNRLEGQNEKNACLGKEENVSQETPGREQDYVPSILFLFLRIILTVSQGRFYPRERWADQVPLVFRTRGKPSGPARTSGSGKGIPQSPLPM